MSVPHCEPDEIVRLNFGLQKNLETCLTDALQKMKTLDLFQGTTPAVLRTQLGSQYDHQWMVIGRAVNGWGDNLSDGLTKENARRDGLGWIYEAQSSRYNPNTSKFWQAIRQLASKYYRDICSLPQHIKEARRLAWSNLYRITRSSEKNSPLEKICKPQRSGCINLLHADIELLHPQRILVATGLNWAKEMSSLFDQDSIRPIEDSSYNWVEALGLLQIANGKIKIPTVITVHPDQREAGYEVSQLVNEAQRAFQDLGAWQ